MMKCLTNPTLSYVRRMYAFRKVLYLFDFDDEESITLKDFVFELIFQGKLAEFEEGVKCLEFILTIDLNLSLDIHLKIKNSFLELNKEKAQFLGKLYANCWKHLSKEKSIHLADFEVKILQDLMHCSVYTANLAIINLLQEFMFSFHHGSLKSSDFAQLLIRLYEPILWRSLKAPHPQVRINGAMLFFNLFPLKDPLVSSSKNEEFLNTQFKELHSLLNDVDQRIRKLAIKHTFKILKSKHQELPNESMAEVLTFVLEELSLDHSSGASCIRIEVILGVLELINCEELQEMVFVVIPNLTFLLHDRCEKVRIHFMDCVLQIKKMPGIKLFEIFNINEFLYRLANDTSNSVKDKICELLCTYYLPVKKSCEEKATRVKELVDYDFDAAFYFLSWSIHKKANSCLVSEVLICLMDHVFQGSNMNLVEGKSIKSERSKKKSKISHKCKISVDLQDYQEVKLTALLLPILSSNFPESSTLLAKYIIKNHILDALKANPHLEAFFWSILSDVFKYIPSFKTKYIHILTSKALENLHPSLIACRLKFAFSANCEKCLVLPWINSFHLWWLNFLNEKLSEVNNLNSVESSIRYISLILVNSCIFCDFNSNIH